VLTWVGDLIARHGAPPPEAHGRRVLLMVRELHRLGYERLRIAPGLSASGGAWRCDVVPAAETCREKRRPHATGTVGAAHYSTGMGATYFGWADAERDLAAQLAAGLSSGFRRSAPGSAGTRRTGRGSPRWFGHGADGLPYAYWDSYGDWSVDMTRLKTTAGGPYRCSAGKRAWRPM
jgi:hypothetical protein